MSRFDSVLKKLDPDKQDAINAWIKNATAPKTTHDPVTTNIAKNLKTEEHFDQTALEGFLNALGDELIKSPNIGESLFKILAENYILKGDRITVSIPSNKHYRLVSLDGLSRAMDISGDDKDDIIDFITIAFENSDDEPIYGDIGKVPVWSTFSWPKSERPYNGFAPKQSLDKSGINIKEDDAMELVFKRKTVEPIKYPTVADGVWNEFFRVSERSDPFGYAQDLST